jgi:hypothetical protein
MHRERRHSVVPGKRKLSGTRAPKQRATGTKKTSSTLDRVREGVRRFILNDVSIGDFHNALRTAVRKGELSPNPLTGAAFRKIVTQVMSERKRTSKKSPQQ